MKRIASQLVFCSPDKILLQTAVEQGSNGEISALHNLMESRVELSGTEFFDGILSATTYSLAANHFSVDEIADNYQYIFLGNTEIPIIKHNSMPLVLDLGTDNIEEINRILEKKWMLLSNFSIIEIVAACSYYPVLLSRKNATLEPGLETSLILWQGCDLVNRKIREGCSIRTITD